MQKILLIAILLSTSSVFGQQKIDSHSIEVFVRKLVEDSVIIPGCRFDQEPLTISLPKVTDDLFKTRVRTKSDSTLLDDFRASIPIIEAEYLSLEKFRFNVKQLGLKLKRNHDVYTRMSLPFFNPTRDIALVQISDVCPGLCGGGRVLIYVKKDGQWTHRMSKGWLH